MPTIVEYHWIKDRRGCEWVIQLAGNTTQWTAQRCDDWNGNVIYGGDPVQVISQINTVEAA